jgi:hypothetical protein
LPGHQIGVCSPRATAQLAVAWEYAAAAPGLRAIRISVVRRSGLWLSRMMYSSDSEKALASREKLRARRKA